MIEGARSGGDTAVDARAALLVVNYGSHAMLAENVARTTLPDATLIVVVDNYTTQAERRDVSSLCAQNGWELVAPDANLGFGEGMNVAARHARSRGAEIFVLLNPDAYLKGEGAASLIASVAADHSAMVAPLVLRPDGSHFSSAMELDLTTGYVRRSSTATHAKSVGWLSGACLALHCDLWERVGGFNADYFLYWEDVDLSFRVLAGGGYLSVDDGVIAVHSEGGTQLGDSTGSAKSATYYFYNVRNRLVFAAQHLDRTGQRAWQKKTLQNSWSVLMRGGRRQLINPFRTVFPVLKGMWSGWRYMRETTLSKGSEDASR